jgi:hypothetical protein
MGAHARLAALTSLETLVLQDALVIFEASQRPCHGRQKPFRHTGIVTSVTKPANDLALPPNANARIVDVSLGLPELGVEAGHHKSPNAANMPAATAPRLTRK